MIAAANAAVALGVAAAIAAAAAPEEIEAVTGVRSQIWEWFAPCGGDLDDEVPY